MSIILLALLHFNGTKAANLQRWITSQSGSLSQNDFNRASKVWTGVEMVAQFGLMGVSPATFDVLKVCTMVISVMNYL